jgi:pimeloyl-ACP methyl ester carboxylesterase
MSKINVYFMPGMAASSKIFERIHLPEQLFEMHFLEWQLPDLNETLVQYAQRMATFITHRDCILIGVSFGGILLQEMKPFVNAKKIIIISSVKSNLEFPKKMRWARSTRFYKLIPTVLFGNLDFLAKLTFNSYTKQRVALYKIFFSRREKAYLDWAIEKILFWDRIEVDNDVIHIHGDKDEVFPIEYIVNPIVVKGGTHIMILNKYKWMNENLPKIMLSLE